MYSPLTYDVMKSYISHVCETRKFVMAILHWKQGLLCDKIFKEKWINKTLINNNSIPKCNAIDICLQE